MSRSIYLSVDLDFWCDGAGDYAWPGARRMLKQLLELAKPMVMVADHGHMLEHIEKYPCDCLVNIDAHSDMWNQSSYERIIRREPDCSNWVNAVRWQKGKEYVWLHPFEITSTSNFDCGFCHGDDPNPFNKRNRPKHAWKKASHKHGMLGAASWKCIRAVGISISEAWLDYSSFAEESIRWALKHNIRIADAGWLGREAHLDIKLIEEARERYGT